MAPVNRLTVRKLRSENSADALRKYATVGRMFTIKSERSEEYYIDTLLDTIQAWTAEMNIPSLHEVGVRAADSIDC